MTGIRNCEKNQIDWFNLLKLNKNRVKKLYFDSKLTKLNEQQKDCFINQGYSCLG